MRKLTPREQVENWLCTVIFLPVYAWGAIALLGAALWLTGLV
jgi:hypothetical protein